MTHKWSQDDGLIDVTASFLGITQPLHELIDDIHRRGWTVGKIKIKDGQYIAEGKSPHGEKLVANGRTDATAVANLLVRVMRRDHLRASAVRSKLGAWDHRPIEQQLSAIAQAYAGAPVYEPKAASAWMELAQDCSRRAQTIRTQLTVEYTADPVPYATADELRDDVTHKRHVVVTNAYAHHPVWSEAQMLDYRLCVDVLGHTLGGADWGWHGTCLAFAQLAPLLAEAPQKALFTELLGQAAFGTFYRQWGPQKICFLDKLVEKEQAKQNQPGHSGVHPSQSIVPAALPSIFSAVADGIDPNADWSSGVTPLQDNAYLWQRQDGVDPLDSQGLMEHLRSLHTGVANMHPEMQKQAVVNALRSSLLGTRNNPRGHAVHYQTVAGIPASVDDPIAYWDALEQAREGHNQLQGYAPESHKQYWPQEQQFKQWVKAFNPRLDDGEVQRAAKRELLHMLSEEEERILSQDEGEQLPAEVVEHEAYEAMRRRLKALTKPNVDQKVDFGDDHLFHKAMAADPYWLDAHIERNGPYMWHALNDPTHLDSVLQQGLLPWNQIPGFHPRFDKDLHPRPDHVYMKGSRNHPEFDEYRNPQMVRIDLRKLDPENINPDEDAMNNYAERLWGTPRQHPVGLSRGEHAEQQGWGDQPSQTAWSIENINTLAHRGPIPPEAIDYVYDPNHAFEPSSPPPEFRGSIAKTATYHADMYPPYLVSHMRPIAQISRHADELAEAAREDLLSYKGHGNHFRAQALKLGIPHLGPRQISNAWLHLSPQTSQLGVINPEVADTLGLSYPDLSNRDYFKAERMLGAGRDAAGYGHLPLGAFSAGIWDQYAGGPGWHPDRTPFKPYGPTPHHSIDWQAQTPAMTGWTDPYWWNSTQQARDQAAQDFDRSIAVEHSRDEIPFQKMAGVEWQPGQWAKGIVLDGNVHVWPTDNSGIDYMGSPHHGTWLRDNAGIEINNASDNHRWSDPVVISPEGWYTVNATRQDSIRQPERFAQEAQGLKYVRDPDKWRHRVGSHALGATSQARSPWVMAPDGSGRLTGAPGASLMQHLKDTFGHQSAQEVWNQDYDVGKGPGATLST